MKLTRSEIIAIVMIELREGKNGQQLANDFNTIFSDEDVVIAIKVREMMRRACGIAQEDFSYEDKFEILNIIRELRLTTVNYGDYKSSVLHPLPIY